IQDQGGVRGQFNFNAQRTGLFIPSTDPLANDKAAVAAATASNNGLANAFASFLLDAPGFYSRDIKIIDQPGTKQYDFFTFFQDNWQVSPKLTVNLGLRHEYYTPLVGIVDQGGLSNYNPINNTEIVAGYGDISQSVGVKGTWKNFVARTGISYRLNDKTVIRGGGGGGGLTFSEKYHGFDFPGKQKHSFNRAREFSPGRAVAGEL